MDAFVRRLIERLHAPGRPLTRNRHFHTFETPEGRTALRISRRLQSLRRDILACVEEGRSAICTPLSHPNGEHRVELRLERVSGRRIALLRPAELELLRALPGMANLLPSAPPEREPATPAPEQALRH